MSNDVIIPANMGQLSARFQGMATDNELSAGIAAGFGLIGYKGKVWSIKYRGDEIQLMRPDGDGPQNSIEVVILKSSNYISKIFYEDGYVEGSVQPPDCFSTNGVVPDVSAVKKQSATCALCPKNAWGSRISAAGKAGKACSDSKRLAVVPAADIPNETFGGALLLRVPAASLQDVATFGNKMKGVGYPYFGVVAKIAFDTTEAYPKFLFSAVRALSDAEAELVLQMRNSPEVSRLLAEDVGGVPQASAAPQTHEEKLAAAFEQPPVATQPVQEPKPKPPEPAPVQQAAAAAPVDMAAEIAKAVAAAMAAMQPHPTTMVTPEVTEPVAAPKKAAAKKATTGGFGGVAAPAPAAEEPAPAAASTVSAGGFGAGAAVASSGPTETVLVAPPGATPEFTAALDKKLAELLA